MRRVIGGVAAAAVLCALASPAPAMALVTCNFNGDVITVTAGQTSDLPELSVSPTTGAVVVSGTGVPDPSLCRSGLPETNKVARIEVTQAGANQDGTVAIHTETPFAPGAGDAGEGAGAPELEIDLLLGGGNDIIDLLLGDGADNVRLGALAGGSSGIDLNVGAEAVGADGDDVSMSGVEGVSILGGFGNDGNVIDARGGPEFAGPLALGLGIAGAGGDDVLSAGVAGSILAGNGGNDTLRGGPGDDTLRGNAGRDALAYDVAASGVTVNLTVSAPQSTGGGGVDTLDRENGPSPDIEDLIGSPFSDILVGSDAANRIDGGAGTDTIAALDGADDVHVDDGVAGDSADCGPGADSASADALGVAPLDTLANCEALALVDRTPPAEPGGPGPTPGPGGGGSGGSGGRASSGGGANTATMRDTTPPRLRLSVRRKQRLASLKVRVTCLDETCSVRGSGTVRIAGAAKKRRLSSRPLRLTMGVTGTLRFKLPARSKRIALAALRDDRRVAATVRVKARDAAGNMVTKKHSIRLR